MRLLYLLTAYPRWSETFVRQDIRLLLEAGAGFRLLSLFPGDCIPEQGWPACDCLTPSGASGAGRGYGMPACPGWLRERLSLWTHRHLLKRLLDYCSAHGIEFIYADFADLAALLACEAATRLGIRYAVGLHAHDVHAFKYSGRLLQKATALFVCNAAARKALWERFPFCREKTRLIPHGIDLARWHFRRSRGAKRTLLFAGRLVPKKGLAILLDAVRLLAEEGEALELVVAGDGPLAETLRKRAEGLPLRWMGRCSRNEVRELMQEAGALVVPSVEDAQGDSDGIPNVMLEAMAIGLPVIGSRAGGLPELLTEQTGWTVPQLAPAPLAQAIRLAFASPEACLRRSEAARRAVEECFDARTLSKERMRCLQEAFDASPANGNWMK